mmetsp:Transcript_83271/g.222619  ORF Transcript_83271/g.222619 Transcript_83271/m.222619 type:complete len:247 (-) Transcript_83271:1418-2158(-)
MLILDTVKSLLQLPLRLRRHLLSLRSCLPVNSIFPPPRQLLALSSIGLQPRPRVPRAQMCLPCAGVRNLQQLGKSRHGGQHALQSSQAALGLQPVAGVGGQRIIQKLAIDPGLLRSLHHNILQLHLRHHWCLRGIQQSDYPLHQYGLVLIQGSALCVTNPAESHLFHIRRGQPRSKRHRTPRRCWNLLRRLARGLRAPDFKSVGQYLPQVGALAGRVPAAFDEPKVGDAELECNLGEVSRVPEFLA